MNKLKKLLALVLALAICATFALPALATEDSHKVPNTEGKKVISIAKDSAKGHTYKVYQIFAGDVDATQDILSNVEVGSSITGFHYPKTSTDNYNVGEKVPSTVLDQIVDLHGEQFAKELFAGDYGDLVDEPYATLKAEDWTAEVEPGYYLIVDDAATAPEGEEVSPLMLYVISDATITPKIDQTTFKKTVEQANGEYNDFADKNVGKEFLFKLTATVQMNEVPSSPGTYDLVFNDEMSVGLDFVKIESVTVDGDELEAKTEGAYGYTLEGAPIIVDGKEENKFKLSFDLVQALGESERPTGSIEVVVTYKAKLNNKAIIFNPGSTGDTNTNKASLDYGADGKTTTVVNYVYSFELKGTKVAGDKPLKDSNGNTKPNEYESLSGAGFQLYWEYNTENKTGEIVKLYTVDGVEGVFAAPRDEEIPEGATPVTGTEIETENGKTGRPNELLVGNDGTFSIKGLPAGNYVLVETTTPDGYNTMDPMNVEIKAEPETNEDGSIKVDDSGKPIMKVTYIYTGAENGSGDVQVINQKGSTLPSTGGIGTTIFYIVGAVLVVGAGVLLFTKRRAKG